MLRFALGFLCFFLLLGLVRGLYLLSCLLTLADVRDVRGPDKEW